MNEKIKRTPEEIFEEHSLAVQYKASLGDKGVFEQTKRNERFYNGDQWHGAKVGNDRPLVRHNVIKRIGDYKLSVLGASPLSVNFTADGIPNTLNLRNRVEDETEVDFYEQTRKDLANGDESKQILDSLNEVDKINVVMGALGDYFNVCSERMKFTTLCEQVLKNSYISGTGVLFTYWDSTIKTGLYADKGRTMPIDGDIVCEVIDIENVDFGDTSEDDVQKQPYIIISQRQSVAELKRQARRNGRPEHEVAQITPDSDYTYMSGDLAGNEPSEAGKCTVLTKVWKEYNKTGTEYVVKAIKVCEKAVIKDEWDIGVKIYPISKFAWEKRRNCTYGESEITYLVPNQIAINRMLTASVWAVMMMGMPIMMVNSDVINQPLTNNPGQVVRFSGSAEDFNNAISYVSPPNFSPNFDQNIQSLISNTLSSTGAYDAALGDVAPTNTSAIIATREAAMMPLQVFQNRYYQFIEDTARIWAEFWVRLYGDRALKIVDSQGVWYLPFKAEEYANLVISTKVDVGASTIWSQAQSVQTLDNLFASGVIDAVQYLERMPKGVVPNISGLVKEMKATNQALQEQAAASGGQMGMDFARAMTGQAPEDMTGQMPEGMTGQAPEELPEMTNGGISEKGIESEQSLGEEMPSEDYSQTQENSDEMQSQENEEDFDVKAILAQLSPEEQEAFLSLSEAQQEQILMNAFGEMQAQTGEGTSEESQFDVQAILAQLSPKEQEAFLSLSEAQQEQILQNAYNESLKGEK